MVKYGEMSTQIISCFCYARFFKNETYYGNTCGGRAVGRAASTKVIRLLSQTIIIGSLPNYDYSIISRSSSISNQIIKGIRSYDPLIVEIH